VILLPSINKSVNLAQQNISIHVPKKILFKEHITGNGNTLFNSRERFNSYTV
jgi:hypothetical protein